MSKRRLKQAKPNQVEILRRQDFLNKYTSWTSPSNAPSALFPPTPASVIGYALATDNCSGYLSASAITIRACEHDGTLHLNEDLFWIRETPQGGFIQEKIYTAVHRYPPSGSYAGPLAWDDVRGYFGVPSGSVGDVGTFLIERGKLGPSPLS